MTTKGWDAVDWSSDADIIANVAPWITPQELDAIREKGARKHTPAICVAIKFMLAEAIIDGAVKAIAQPHRSDEVSATEWADAHSEDDQRDAATP